MVNKSILLDNLGNLEECFYTVLELYQMQEEELQETRLLLQIAKQKLADYGDEI